MAELTDSFELLMDIVDFTTLAKQSLKDITLNIVDFKVTKNLSPQYIVYL